MKYIEYIEYIKYTKYKNKKNIYIIYIMKQYTDIVVQTGDKKGPRAICSEWGEASTG